MGPQDPKDVNRNVAHRLRDAALRHRLEDAHAAVEAALVEARRRARLNEERAG
jgi:hypothetical protein